MVQPSRIPALESARQRRLHVPRAAEIQQLHGASTLADVYGCKCHHWFSRCFRFLRAHCDRSFKIVSRTADGPLTVCVSENACFRHSSATILRRCRTMQPLVEQIEKMFLPDLEHVAGEMRGRFPNLKFNVWQWPKTAQPEYKDYDLGVECLFPVPAKGARDNVALIIEVCFLDSTPRLNGSVVWVIHLAIQKPSSVTITGQTPSGQKPSQR